jgi:multicomponent Na+:H+ antiporter subunit G
MSTWITSALTLVALVVMTLGVAGLARMPTLRLRLHAAAKVGAVGIVLLSVAAAVAGAGLRALLVAAFVLITAPVSSHVLAAAGAEREEHDTP